MEKKTLGSFLTALRKANGMTQKELADRLNVSDKAVSRWERDENCPDLTLIPIIADIFGVTSDELLRGERSTAESGARRELSERSEREVKNIAESGIFRYTVLIAVAAGCVFLGCLGMVLSGGVSDQKTGEILAAIALFLGYVLWFGAVLAIVLYFVALRRRLTGLEGSGEIVDRSIARIRTMQKWALIGVVPALIILLSGSDSARTDDIGVGFLAYLAIVAVLAALCLIRPVHRFRSIVISSEEEFRRFVRKMIILAVAFAALWGIVFYLGDVTDGAYFGIGKWFFNMNSFTEYMQEKDSEEFNREPGVVYRPFSDVNVVSRKTWFDGEANVTADYSCGYSFFRGNLCKFVFGDTSTDFIVPQNTDVEVVLAAGNPSALPIRTFTENGAEIGFWIWIFLLIGIAALYCAILVAERRRARARSEASADRPQSSGNA